MPLTIDHGYVAAVQAIAGSDPPPKFPVGDVQSRRGLFDSILDVFSTVIPEAPDVSVQKFSTKASDGHEIELRWYTKANSKPGSAVLYAHGGGMICLQLDKYDKLISNYVQHTGVPILAPEYRLAPEVQSPTLVTDVYAGLEYLVSNASSLGVDKSRIGIMGDSAGGGIAASLAHYIKAHNGPQVKKQILIYPMLDDRTTAEDRFIEPFAMWTTNDNKTGWSALLGSRAGGPDVKPYEAAGRATVADLEGLPPAYIDVGQLDIFRDEDLEYALKLGKAGVDCEFHLVPSLPHAYEAAYGESPVTQAIMGHRMRAIVTL